MSKNWLGNLCGATPIREFGIWRVDDRGSMQYLAVVASAPGPGKCAMPLAGLEKMPFADRRRKGGATM